MTSNSSLVIRQKIINALINADFCSGELLGQQFGISRAAIAKHIKCLMAMGIDIFSVTGKGYRLAQPIKLLEAATIQKLLQAKCCDISFELHSIIDSTNDQLLQNLSSGLTDGYTCIAEYQTAGRGRRGRQWISPFASHIYLSMYWPLQQGMAEAMGLSMVSALAIADAIRTVSGLSAQLKWPNDVYLSGKKLAGVLIELESQAQEFQHSVIGIGLNIAMPAPSAEQITQPWTDLNSETGRIIDRNLLVAELIFSLTNRLQQHQKQGIGPLLVEWHKQDLFLNRHVKLITGQQQTQGIYRGVNEQGALLLEIDGATKVFYSGEVSLRAVV